MAMVKVGEARAKEVRAREGLLEEEGEKGTVEMFPKVSKPMLTLQPKTQG